MLIVETGVECRGPGLWRGRVKIAEDVRSQFVTLEQNFPTEDAARSWVAGINQRIAGSGTVIRPFDLIKPGF